MSAIIEEFLAFGVYKRSQGRIVRQVTFGALAVTLLIGLWKLVMLLRGYGSHCPAWIFYGLPAVLAIAGFWASYRAVNVHSFADFLIAVEAEMNKVTWPTWGELMRWSVVVIVVIFAVGFLLYGFDVVWIEIFKFFGVYALPAKT